MFKQLRGRAIVPPGILPTLLRSFSLRFTTFLRGRPGLVITLVAALIGTTTLGFAAATTAGVIYACVNNSSGTIKIVTASDGCPTDWIAISWNRDGPTGATGATGSSGAKGDTGPAGPGIATLDSLTGLPCNSASGAPGTTRVTYADGTVSLQCDVPLPTGQTAAPVFTTASVSAAVAAVTFSKPICRTQFSPVDWSVTVNAFPDPVVADSVPICNVAADNGVSTANLLLVTPAPNGALVTVTLNAVGSSTRNFDLRDSDGNTARAPQTRITTATAPETIRPTIMSATASIGATILTLTFSEPAYCTALSFDSSDITINDGDPNTADPPVVGMGSDPCAFSAVTADRSFSIQVGLPFLPGKSYTVSVTPEPNEIRDVAGNSLLPTEVPIVIN